MAIEAEEVAHIAHLARLTVDESDVPRLAGELTRILDLVEQMDRADTDEVEPMAHPLDAVQPLRPDEVTESDQRELLQRGAPAVDQGLYLVPKVID